MDSSRLEYRSIQYLRGVAAALVVLAHGSAHPLPSNPAAVVLSARLGVAIFFVISGFIITIVCGPKPFDPGKFIYRRFARIIPLYWAATILTASICLVAPSLFKDTHLTLGHFVQSLLFIPHPAPSAPDSFAPLYKLGWTLNYEVFFYLLVTLFTFKLSFEKRSAFLIIVMAALVGAGVFAPSNNGLLKFYTNPWLLNFAAGVLLGWLTLSGRLTNLWKHTSLLLGLGFVGFVALPIITKMRLDELGPSQFVMAGASFCLVASLLVLEIQRRLPHSKVLNLAGDASYSMYLTHMFFVGAVWAVGMKVLHPFQSAPAYALVAAAAVIGSLLVGTTVYILFEKPLMAVILPKRRHSPVDDGVLAPVKADA